MATHMMAEITSRYDLRCVKCGRRALDTQSGETCPVRDDVPESRWWDTLRAKRESEPTP